ncbi:lipoyl(octanoyl) transferase LipB [Desulfospira joergensenii]|uniref:lipoyl(octanoyl) transferase LipB n=1 Tax=Desulfospira joergensenii TaxID=53329 RepID=UPI0003B5A379|nr:lipoyl(octanoyl) transferase LipB [Desulfospira joergensenii]
MKAEAVRKDQDFLESDLQSRNRSCIFTDLGLADYADVLILQGSTRDEMIKDPALPDRVFFVQHPSVYTLGKRGGRENLTVSESFLESKGIPIVQTGRGGNITYHGPGQAVLYPVIHLERARIGVADFVAGLEEIMKRTASDFGVPADRNERNHGLWVGNKKIGSVGISIQKGVSIHGLALNLNPDLTPFSWINPCGLADMSMTSIEKEVEGVQPSVSFSMDRVKSLFIQHFSDIFDYAIAEEEHEN